MADQAQACEAPERAQDDDPSGSCPLQPALDLPASERARSQEVRRDLQGRLRSRGISVDLGAATAHGIADYSASLMPSTPTSMVATLPRISSSILVAISWLAFRKSRAFSRPCPRRVSP